MSTKSISQEKLEANRRNAQKSTGPKTPEGKARSSRNALKHGLLAKCIVLREDDPHENALDFEQLLESLAADLRPEGASEQILVEQLATCYWRLRRAYRFEANDIDRLRDLTEIPSSAARLQSPDFRNDSARIVFPSPDNLQRLVRYETMIERQLHRTLKHLNCLQRARRLAQTSPTDTNEESPSTPPPKPTPPQRSFSPANSKTQAPSRPGPRLAVHE